MRFHRVDEVFREGSTRLIERLFEKVSESFGDFRGLQRIIREVPGDLEMKSYGDQPKKAYVSIYLFNKTARDLNLGLKIQELGVLRHDKQSLISPLDQT